MSCGTTAIATCCLVCHSAFSWCCQSGSLMMLGCSAAQALRVNSFERKPSFRFQELDTSQGSFSAISYHQPYGLNLREMSEGLMSRPKPWRRALWIRRAPLKKQDRRVTFEGSQSCVAHSERSLPLQLRFAEMKGQSHVLEMFKAGRTFLQFVQGVEFLIPVPI